MHTPGFPLVLTFMSQQAAADLARDLAVSGRLIQGVNAEAEAAQAFAGAWRDHTADVATVHRRMRPFRLDALVPPDPAPVGAPRLATGPGLAD